MPAPVRGGSARVVATRINMTCPDRLSTPSGRALRGRRAPPTPTVLAPVQRPDSWVQRRMLLEQGTRLLPAVLDPHRCPAWPKIHHVPGPKRYSAATPTCPATTEPDALRTAYRLPTTPFVSLTV